MGHFDSDPAHFRHSLHSSGTTASVFGLILGCYSKSQHKRPALSQMRLIGAAPEVGQSWARTPCSPGVCLYKTYDW